VRGRKDSGKTKKKGGGEGKNNLRSLQSKVTGSTGERITEEKEAVVGGRPIRGVKRLGPGGSKRSFTERGGECLGKEQKVRISSCFLRNQDDRGVCTEFVARTVVLIRGGRRICTAVCDLLKYRKKKKEEFDKKGKEGNGAKKEYGRVVSPYEVLRDIERDAKHVESPS